jgi:hypothetical protein
VDDDGGPGWEMQDALEAMQAYEEMRDKNVIQKEVTRREKPIAIPTKPHAPGDEWLS